MITTGVVGHEWRASVSPWGSIEPWGDEPPVGWFVAADDRWHVPANESAVRQARIDGTPVVETRIRVPNGDVVQRVYSVADRGGLTVIEVENESTMPVAVAFDRRELLTERPIADIPIDGIDLPDGAFVLPLAHRATIRVAISHARRTDGRLADPLPTPMQVVRGWLALTERASRLVLPDGATGSSLAAAVTAERCEIALGSLSTADDDPAAFALQLGELVRLGGSPEPWLPELVDAVERLGPMRSWDADVALAAADRVLSVAGESRAQRDLFRIIADRVRSPRPDVPPEGVRGIAWIESALATDGVLLPDGFPAGWLGQSLDVYGVPTGPASAVSFAIRWHGPRPAVLWDQSGEPIELSSPVLAPGWSASSPSGETLWPPPPSGTEGASPSFS